MRAYHFFRPLLSTTHAWSAFVWQTCPAAGDDLAEATKVAASAAPLGRLHPLFLPCQAAWLDDAGFSQWLRPFAPGTAIPCLPPEAATQADLAAACAGLRARDLHVGLRVAEGMPLASVPPASFDHLLIDVGHARNGIPLIDLINAHNAGFQLVAEGVRTHELFDWACAKRFSLTSGEFVAVNDPRAQADADTARLKLLKLLSLVVQDADTREIEEIFRQEPKLSYNLLRLVNSVAVAPKAPITGFNQAITVLGRRQLQRWLQLLIYANQFSQGSRPNPLLQLAAARGRLMELLVTAQTGGETQAAAGDIDEVGEAAFMVGIFSLLDTLLNMPMREVLASLPVAPPIAAALDGRHGLLGQLLDAIARADTGDLVAASERLRELGIHAHDHVEAQVAAYTWACRINLD